jgi:hypothetical protein
MACWRLAVGKKQASNQQGKKRAGLPWLALADPPSFDPRIPSIPDLPRVRSDISFSADLARYRAARSLLSVPVCIA